MRVSEASRCFLDYHRINSKTNTVRNYQFIFTRFCNQFGDRELESLTNEEILTFLTQFTEGTKQSTKRLRYSLLSAFFNFIKSSINPQLQNPCETPILKKLFKDPKPTHWKILEKELVDEIIFRTEDQRNRLMLELMARGGMRVGEVLKLTPRDIEDRKLILTDPKSGKEAEVVFIPQKVADRLKDYIRNKRIEPDQRIFPITYPAARAVVKKAGRLVRINLKPHDLRRHAATYASRSGTPIEIVSKVILRHANLSTTQRYLGKVSDMEAMRWIENLYG
ncbi:MAG: site-specific integrase [Deltaproteobacteria bacterium]|nr:site-specific integrase [Deltaproteobacteria bacterium]MBW2002120.1 site-specific integrase [Deltaproteobacteria bacterium]